MTDNNIPVTGPQKAVIGSVIGGVLSILTVFQVALSNEIPIDGGVILNAVIAGLVFAAGIFGGVYQTTNKVTYN